MLILQSGSLIWSYSSPNRGKAPDQSTGRGRQAGGRPAGDILLVGTVALVYDAELIRDLHGGASVWQLRNCANDV